MQPKIGAKLLKQLSKTFPPSELVRFRFGRYDVAAKTDTNGNPIVLYIGKADEQGLIRGDQFTRKLLKDDHGMVLKDHWDYKGSV